MISGTNFGNLELLEKNETAVEEQIYEEVAGFESLNSKVQTRTTAFSCKDDGEDYGENFLMSRPLPWVVRVYFKMEGSMKGILCSGKGYYHLHPICQIFDPDPKYVTYNFQLLSLIISGW